MNKQLIQEVIDRLSLSYPNREQFEIALVEFLKKFPTDYKGEINGIRFYCETQSIDENATTEN